MISFDYRNGMYLILLDGRAEEAYREFSAFRSALRSFRERWSNRRVS